MTIKYHLYKDQPASGNWADESSWTMLVDINNVRVGHMTMAKEKLIERLEKAHGKPTLARTGLSLCGLWPGRDVTYFVVVEEPVAQPVEQQQPPVAR